MSKKTKKKDEELWTSTNGLPKWKQSPIDLNPMYTLHQTFPPLILQGHLSARACGKMTNTGSTVKIEFPMCRLPIVKGGPLQSAEYQFSELQFRWGPSNARGAEHSVDGVWFSMEAQAIHWNKSYESLDKCYEKDDGIAIVAFLFQVIGCHSMIDNEDFARITDNLPQIKIPGRTTELPAGCLNWMADVCSDSGYYTYSGSFTTNPFVECVTWIVVPRPVKISARQAKAFRDIYSSQAEHILSNFRSEQKIHDRKVFLATK